MVVEAVAAVGDCVEFVDALPAGSIVSFRHVGGVVVEASRCLYSLE